jgi:hypothetical protein
MQRDEGLEAFFATIRAWLEIAEDDEVLALAAIVEAELERRGADEPPAPGGGEPGD